MTSGFTNTHFTGSAFLTVMPSKQCIAYLFCTEVQLLLSGWWGASCRSQGRGFASCSLLNTPGGTCSVNLIALWLQMFLQSWRHVFEAWYHFFASKECTANLNVLTFSWHKLKMMTVFPGWKRVSSCWKHDLSHTWHHSPRRKKKAKIYIFTKENDKNNSNAQWLE